MRLFRVINSKMIKGRIKNRILMYSVSLLMFNLLIIAGISYYISSKTIIERVSETNRQILEQTMGNIDFVLRLVENTSVQMFDNETLVELLDKAKNGDVTVAIECDKEIKGIISKLLTMRDEAEIVYIVSDSHTRGEKRGIYSNEQFARLQSIDIEKFRKLVENSGERFMWTYVNMETLENRYNKRIALCRAIKDQTRAYKGFTLVLLKEGILRHIYYNLVQENRQVFLTDQEGTIVSASNEENVGRRMTDVYRLKPDGTVGIRHMDGERAVISNAVSQYTGWRLYIAEPYDNAISAVRNVRWWIAVVLLTCILVFIGLSVIMSNILTKPINRLLDLASSVDSPNRLLNRSGAFKGKHNRFFAFFKRFNFKTKLSAMLLSIIMLPVVLLMIASYNLSFRVIRAKAEEINALNTKQMKIRVEYYLNSFEKSIYDMHLENEVNLVLQQSMEKNTAGLKDLDKNDVARDVIASMHRKNRDILYIDLYNAGREQVYSYGSNKLPVPEDFIEQLDQAPDVKNMWFGPYQDSYNDYILTLGKKLLDSNDFSFAGYAFVSVREADVGRSYEKGTASNTLDRDIAFIMDKYGYPVTYPDKSAFSAKLGFIFVDEALRRVGENFTGRVDGEEFLISCDAIKNTDWVIVNASSIRSVRKNMQIIYLYYLLVLVFSAVVIANIVLRASRQIGKPLKDLEERVTSFANSSSDPDSFIESGDEIEQLNISFNKMMERIRTLIEEVYEVKIRENEAALKSKQAELTLLQAQINPHFLYNTLEIIRWKAMFLTGGENEVSGLVTTLSDFFRLSLSKGEKMITLKDEIEHARNYLTIINHRYSEKIQVCWHIDPDAADCLVPKIILQPVVENAVYHGIKPRQGEGVIEIYASRKGEDLELRVCDNGTGMDREKLRKLNSYLAGDDTGEKLGYGLKNIGQRIRLRFGEGYGLTIESSRDCGTAVILRMPAIYTPDAAGGASPKAADPLHP